jgi:hypothetical protein
MRGFIPLRTNRSSSGESFWDSILWIRPLGTSKDYVTIFLRDYCILARYVFGIIVF